MRTIASPIENAELRMHEAREKLEPIGFTIGGNWDYDHGCFDLALDQEDKVWLRLPFQAPDGQIDSEKRDQHVFIQFGTPFVLNHLYNEGTEQDADMNVLGGFVNQFQDPVDPDASLDDKWMKIAQEKLSEAESTLLS